MCHCYLGDSNSKLKFSIFPVGILTKKQTAVEFSKNSIRIPIKFERSILNRRSDVFSKLKFSIFPVRILAKTDSSGILEEFKKEHRINSKE